MKDLIKKIVPQKLLDLYRKMKQPPVKYHKEDSIYSGKSVKDTFTEIYKANHWGSEDSVSGTGSDNVQTRSIIKELRPLFDKLGVRSVLDIPCGDFNWMKKVDLKGIRYLGGDIVEAIIERNNRQHAGDHVSFAVIDLLTDELPASDLVFVRDCFVHLSYENVHKAIANIRRSSCTYLLTTTFPKHPVNEDIETGGWRTLDLTQPPFHFSKPLLLLNENCTEFNGAYMDKSLGLWKLSDI